MLADRFLRLPVHYASGTGNADACRNIGSSTSHSAVGQTDMLGRTVLHYAACVDKTSDSVQYFLEEVRKKLKINQRRRRRRRREKKRENYHLLLLVLVLFFIIIYSSSSFFFFFLQGVKPDQADNQDLSAIHFAAMHGNRMVMEWLLDRLREDQVGKAAR